MEKKEKSKLEIAKKTLKILMKIMYQLLIFVCVILIIIIAMQRITNSNQSFYGYRLFRIISGSMIPKFNVGEVVICKETPGDKIKIGDAIVYRGKIGELNNKLVMHEVVAVNHDEKSGELEFYAKGINNNEEDPKVTTDQILGVVKFKSKSLTVLYSLATSIYSSFVIVTVLVINVFVSFKTPREPRKPRQLAESETKQNENVIIENVEEVVKSEDENIKVKANKCETSNEEQQNSDFEKTLKKKIKKESLEIISIENESTNTVNSDKSEKKQSVGNNKVSKNEDVIKETLETNEIKEKKSVKKGTKEISKKNAVKKEILEEKKENKKSKKT